jgi:hypothetical protein
MIGDHTLGDTMLDRLVYRSHRLILTSGWSRRLGTPESPTDNPHRLRPCPVERHQPKNLTAMVEACWEPGGSFVGKYLIDIDAIRIAPKCPRFFH